MPSRKGHVFIAFSFLLTGLLIAASSHAATWEYNFADVQGDQWMNDWLVIDGEFAVEDGSIFQSAPSADDNNAFRAIAQTPWEITDGTIEVAMWHEGAGLNDALLFYRMQDNDNGYASRLQLDGYITVGSITDGRHAHIEYIAMPVQADTEYIVKVELEGSQITVSVDDEEKLIVDDDSSLSGRVGFGMSRCAGGAHLSWIRVTGDGVTPSAVEPGGKLSTTWGSLK